MQIQLRRVYSLSLVMPSVMYGATRHPDASTCKNKRTTWLHNASMLIPGPGTSTRYLVPGNHQSNSCRRVKGTRKDSVTQAVSHPNLSFFRSVRVLPAAAVFIRMCKACISLQVAASCSK